MQALLSRELQREFASRRKNSSALAPGATTPAPNAATSTARVPWQLILLLALLPALVCGALAAMV